jgi:hypothetical protein
MRILFKLPSRERESKFFGAVDNIVNNVVTDNYCILATLDNNDPVMNNTDVIERLKGYPMVIPVYGDSKTKIEAVNANMDMATDWDILCLHSDDMFFTKKGFDLDIREAMQTHFPDTDGMLHFPDQVAGEKLCTYQIIGRKYYERSGYIYNPEFSSLWCDNEEMDKAKLLGKYAFIDKSILEHRHHSWGFGPADDLLRKTERFYRKDEKIYLRHKAENFGIK